MSGLGPVLLPLGAAVLDAGRLALPLLGGGTAVLHLERPAASAAALEAALARPPLLCELRLEGGRLTGACTAGGRDITDGPR